MACKLGGSDRFGSVLGGTHFTREVGTRYLPIHAADFYKLLSTRNLAQRIASMVDYGSDGLGGRVPLDARRPSSAMSRFGRDSTAEPFYDWVAGEVSLAGESDWKLGSERSGIEREVQFRGASDISGFGGLGVCSGVT